MDKLERRFVSFAEFRDSENTKTLRGHAATFDDVYSLGMFEERIAPGAFDDVLEDDVRALFNHDSNHVLGRTKSGTLRLSIDERGLFTEIDLPESATHLREAIERGDVDQMSFGFTVAGDEWETNEDTGRELRTITKIGRLFDVSPVTFPANPNTDVALRSRELAEAPKEAEAEADAQFGNRRRLDLL
jgi:HK97 family phage prohead protease